ncbi:hypothetical protein [Jiangella rhizosphaerae]|uniref:Twin-arginine translocation signal domain-containing protein n=1 Tax=Jiangella rhizosphaerae TaxID=2293569 RepID=A0A418KP57_9ACTN|nr:hypothetical protein [Jiangella rhizosphaerae]RIQ20870.1 hypothetical protein DY240_16420 [Jiangella rhizosphaerae]
MMQPENPTTADDRSSRRRLLRGAGALAGGAVATAAGVAAASSAQAATGDPVRLGRLNTSGTAVTTVRGGGTGVLAVQNRGAGDGVVATADDSMRAAVRATNRNAENTLGIGGAVVATGEECAAVVAVAHAGHDYAIYAYGYRDATESELGNALHAVGTVYLTGPVYVEGDLVVNGTLYCDDVRPLSDRQRAELRSRAGRARPQAG